MSDDPPLRQSSESSDGSSLKHEESEKATPSDELLTPSAILFNGMASFLGSLISMTTSPTDSEFSKIKMGALSLLEQLSKSSETACHIKNLGGALRGCSLEFRQFVNGEANNNQSHHTTGGDEQPARLNAGHSRQRKSKSENGSESFKGSVRKESCRDDDILIKSPRQTSDDGRSPPYSESKSSLALSSRSMSSISLLDETCLQKLLQPDAIIGHPSRGPLTKRTRSYIGIGLQNVASARRNTQLTFVTPGGGGTAVVAADGQFSMMRLPPSLFPPAAPEGLEIFCGKVGVFLLKNAGSLKVSSTLMLDGPANGWPLTTLCLWIFQKHDVFTSMSIEHTKMRRFLQSIEAGYRRDNPYHNRAHAADVAMRMYSLLIHGIDVSHGMNNQDSCQLLLSCILAAAVHDYMHPGSNNNFQAETSSEVAQIYNYKSPLENFSASCALALADEIGLFSSMPKKVAKKIRMEIIELVLATDMSNHFDLMSSFGNIVAANSAESKLSSLGELNRLTELDSSTVLAKKSFLDEEYETRMLLLKIAMKLSDLAHCSLPWDQHMDWCHRLETEFFLQGDFERREALDVSPLMDRQRPGVSNHRNSVGFFKMFVIPMLEQWVRLYPSCKLVIMQARQNLARHRSLARVSLDGDTACKASQQGADSSMGPRSLSSSFTYDGSCHQEINLAPHPAVM